jgi:inositol-phosphate phosphatase/L-galactose 1-phosphate phosphatase
MSATDSESLKAYLELALACARDAGAVIRAAINRPKQLTEKSNSTDVVTETDKLSEEIVIGRIRAAYPSHAMIAEESHVGAYELTDAPTWFVDPVDGTTNFVHGFPFTCVSIGLQINRQTVVAVVYNPVIDELFYAQLGQGAFLQVGSQEPRRLSVSSTQQLERALVLTEFGYDRTPEGVAEMLRRIERLLLRRVQGMRSMGSCALNMCYVAAGRLDLYYEGKSETIGPKPWDSAAAMLIVHEAGGITADPLTGAPLDFTSGRVSASNSRALFDQFWQCVEGQQ